MSQNLKKEIDVCAHCGGDTKIRNPKGFCDHLYYPDYCGVCKSKISARAQVMRKGGNHEKEKGR